MSSDSESSQAPTSSKKKKYDLDFKLKAIKYAEKINNKSKAARDFKVSRRQIQKWCMAATTLLSL